MEFNDRAVGFDLAGSGPPLVLCHSLGGSRAMFDAQVEALASEHTVLAYDLRGHGESGLGDREPSLDVLAEDLRELIDALDLGPAHLAGQSIGAMTLQAFGSAHPDRLATYVLIDGTARSDPAWDERYTARANRVERDGMSDEEAYELAGRSLGESTKRRDPAFTARYARTLRAAPRDGYAWACRAMVRFDLRPRLDAFRRPVLVAVGAEDVLATPAHAREIAGGIPGAELVEIPACGHVPCLEVPDTLTKLLREWTARHPLA